MVHPARGEFQRMAATPLRDSAFLAKITRPGFTQVLRRERLFRRLDASRYVQAFAAQLHAPFAPVFDNYHELPADAPVHALIRDGVAALPAGFRTLVLSRVAPPALPAAPIARLGWEELQLTLDEVEGI